MNDQKTERAMTSREAIERLVREMEDAQKLEWQFEEGNSKAQFRTLRQAIERVLESIHSLERNAEINRKTYATLKDERDALVLRVRELEKCPACKGEGLIRNFFWRQWLSCARCKGHGRIPGVTQRQS